MKELSIEEKAKAYDEAIERAKMSYHTGDYDKDALEMLEIIFPELKESEDERIRNWLISTLKSLNSTAVQIDGAYEMMLPSIAWLKKQGKKGTNGNEREIPNSEQKPVDKVEPKFHEGDLVILTAGELSTTLQIVNVDTNKKLYWFNDNSYLPIVDEECLHLWTIQDAKDGDVLVCESGWTCIFKTLVNDETFSSYCFMDNTKWFCETGSECHTLNKEFTKAYNGEIKPATKEQRDLLFQKMHEAGYEWDAEKKELKKIEQIPAWSEEDDIMAHDIDYALRCQITYPISRLQSMSTWINNLKNRVQSKQWWSEEDERNINKIIEILHYTEKTSSIEPISLYSKEINWLKSLRPQNWTKKDRERYISCLQRLSTGNPEQPETINSKWFKEHVYPQSTWKPSDEQMKALNGINVTGGVSYAGQAQELRNLYSDLKRLRGE